MEPVSSGAGKGPSEVDVIHFLHLIRLPHRLGRAVPGAALALAGLLFCVSTALAEPLHVSAPLDPALPQAQSRQQALDRAMAEAVLQDALRVLPAPLSPPRAEALRRHLEPKSRELVLSYQEAVTKTQPPAEGQAAPAPASSATTGPATALAFDIEVNRPALRAQLQALGLLSGGARGYALRLGPGVAEGQLRALDELNLLMGLERASAGSPAPLDITLEKLPQGYYKAVLRQAAPGGQPLAADGSDLPAVWRNLFAMLFSGRDYRPGGAARPLEISGWKAVDGVLDFDRLLASWDDCVQDARLASTLMADGGITGRWTARVTNPARLSARLAETLPARGLKLARPESPDGGAPRP